MSLMDRWDRAKFLLSPEMRRLLPLAQAKVAAMDIYDDEKFVALSRINTTSNKNLLRLFVVASDKWLPNDITEVLGLVLPAVSEPAITHLTDAHFRIKTEMRELVYTKQSALGSFLSHSAITVSRESEKIIRYAFRNPDEWDLIASLLRDRDIWGYSDVMETLAVVKTSGTNTLAGGAL